MLLALSHKRLAYTLKPTCASLDTLGPSMVKAHITDISAFLEPSTTASTTAEFAGFLGRATLVTCGTERRSARPHCFETHNKYKMKNHNKSLQKSKQSSPSKAIPGRVF